MEDISKYYELLGLKIGATLPQVKEAYKDLVKVWHPDRFINDPGLQEKAHVKIKEINTAFSKIQEFLTHLDTYQQATGGQRQAATDSSPRPKEPQNAPSRGGAERPSPPAPDSNRRKTKTATNSVSYLPLVLLVAAYAGNYVYLYTKGNLYLYGISGRAVVVLCAEVLGMTILSVLATINYYLKRTDTTRLWAVGLSILQIIIIIGAYAGRTNETSRQSQPAPPAASNIGQPQAPGASASGKADWNKELMAAASAPAQVAPAPSTIKRDDPPPDPADVVWDKPAATPTIQAGAKQDKYRRIAAGDLSALPDKYKRIASGDLSALDEPELTDADITLDEPDYDIESFVPDEPAHVAGRLTSGGSGGFKVSPEAQNAQGKAYYEAQNFAEAVKWWRMAAENGYAPAQTRLGISYVTGKGVAKNAAEAAKWYRLAAVQGNAQAQYNLGVMYDDGDGVPQDTTEAVRLFRKAAEQGNVNAQFNLGVMFDDGKGIAKNRAEAVKWYRMAAAQGDTDAQRNLNVLLSR